MRRLTVLFGALMTTLVLGACSTLPAGRPVDVVRAALTGIAAHELAASAVLVCVERRDPEGFPVTLSGIFSPVQAMPGSSVPRTLAVIELDVSRLSVVERSRGEDGSTAAVAIEGVLVERFDPARVEALFRAYASETGLPVEQDLLDETLAAVSRGPVEIEIRESVQLIQQNGAWRICPPPATP